MQPLVSAGKLFEPQAVGRDELPESGSLKQTRKQVNRSADQDVSAERSRSKGIKMETQGSIRNKSMIISETDDEEIVPKVIKSIFENRIRRYFKLSISNINLAIPGNISLN